MIATLVCLSIFLLVLSGCTQSDTEQDVESFEAVSQGPVISLGKPLPAPRSMIEFVDKADVIVIGTVGTSFREVMEGPYNANELVQDHRDVPPPHLPFTYYEVQIQEIILNDGTIGTKEPLSLRVDGHPSTLLEAEQGEWEMPRSGERYLFVLRKNPDGQSYGTGGWGMLHIDGKEILFCNRTQSTITFTDNRSPHDFIDELKEVVESRQSR